MKQKLKQAGLYAVLAVFTISLTTGFVGVADASPQSRGELTSESAEPSIKAKQHAKVVEELTEKSEVPRSESNNKRPAGGPVELSIKAKHHAEIVEKLTVESSPSLQQIVVHDPTTKSGKDFVLTGDVTTFRAVYAVVNPANIDLRNVEILVTSDTESVRGEMFRQYDQKHNAISVRIDAVDPASINAKITGFEI